MTPEAQGTLAGRFQLFERIGQGGMGHIHRAQDLETGATVAIKRIVSLDPHLHDRFLLEAQLLASFSHPAIVGYVTHGTTAQRHPFLAMQWLEGEDLAQTLARGPLSFADTHALLTRVASGLQAAHRAGVIHRDLKPGNIMLVEGLPQRATLVDFGIARRDAIHHNLTRTGAILGTVGYMAPEQLQGARDIDARADIFALGCVAYECLTGQPAFEGANLGAVIGRLLFGDTPRLRDVVPSIPPDVDALVSRMLAAERDNRFPSAAELLEALARLDTGEVVVAPTLAAPARSTVHTERSPVALVVVLPPSEVTEATLASPSTSGTTFEDALVACQHAARSWHAEHRALAGGVVLSFPSGAALQEQVRSAARAALDILDELSGWRVSLVLSRTENTTAHTYVTDDGETLLSAPTPRGVLLDSAAAAFLSDDFAIADGVLIEHVPSRDQVRLVLGRSAPCMGRNKELRLLEGTLEECLDEETSLAVVLRAQAGVGKSRIRREFVARIEDQDDHVLRLCRCDVGSPALHLGVLRAWIAHALPLNNVPSEERFEHVRAHVLPTLSPLGGLQPPQLLQFLAELLGVEIPEPDPLLVDARTQPREMRQHLQHAFEAWLRAQAREQALVLVLEDLHWADPISISMLTSMWNTLEDLPLMLLVTTWPEGADAHPDLFALRNLQVVDVAPLGRRASQRLVRKLLGDQLDDTQVERLVALSGGNAFLLEELMRHVGAGNTLDTFPGSALAVVQARLAALSTEARTLLRSASVLGERFPIHALPAITPGEPSLDTLRAVLENLVLEEIVVNETQGLDDVETWAFRHSLVRTAAYELLSDADRAHTHLLAGRWLAAQSGVDPAAIVEHLLQAQAFNEAAPWGLETALQHVEVGDFSGAAVVVEIFDRSEVEAQLRTEFVQLNLLTSLFQGNFEVIFAVKSRAEAGEFPRGTPGWGAIVIMVISLEIHIGVPVEQCTFFPDLADARDALEPSTGSIYATSLLVATLMHVGQLDEAHRTAEVLREMAESPEAPPGWWALYGHYVSYYRVAVGDPGALALHRKAVEIARTQCGRMRQMETISPFGTFLLEFGLRDEAQALDDAHSHLAEGPFVGWWNAYFILRDVTAPQPVDCRPRLEALEALMGNDLKEMKHVSLPLFSATRASPSLAQPDDIEIARSAMAQIEPLLEVAGSMLSSRQTVLTFLAQVALNAREPERALECTDGIFSEAHPCLLMPASRARAAWARVRALTALGRHEEAHGFTDEACDGFLRFADGLDPSDREHFLAIPELTALLNA